LDDPAICDLGNRGLCTYVRVLESQNSRAAFSLGFLIFSLVVVAPGVYFPHHFILSLPAIALWRGIGAGRRKRTIAIKSTAVRGFWRRWGNPSAA
jgi:hypothetical protein